MSYFRRRKYQLNRMIIQIATNELFIELDEKDLSTLSQTYSLQDRYTFSFLDDESLLLSLRMEGSDRLCMMYEENELIVFLPFSEFEKWLNSDNLIYHSEKGMNASNNMHITIKKTANVQRIKASNANLDLKAASDILDSNFNYN